MNADNNSHIDKLIDQVLEDNVPADVERRLRARLEGFRASLDQAGEPSAPSPKTPERPIPSPLSLHYLRSIMRSPVSRVAAAAVFVVAIAGVALWINGSGVAPAFADVAQRIINMKSAKFRLSHRMDGQLPNDGKPRLQMEGARQPQDVMWLAPDRTRLELKSGDKVHAIIVMDYQKQRALRLSPDDKTASLDEMVKPEKSELLKVREQLQNAKDNPNVKFLGEKEIEGHRAIGYRITGHTQSSDPLPTQTDIWADAKTLLPLYVEEGTQVAEKAMSIVIFSHFEYDVDPDESLFSVEPPADYTIQFSIQDWTPLAERDLIEMLRRYCQLNAGHFLDSLEQDAINRVRRQYSVILTPGEKLNDAARQNAQTESKIGRGLSFAYTTAFENPDADMHYAGKGLSLGHADKPIFWYRPKKSKKYRVLYADLTVRESDKAPSVPNSQSISDLLNQQR